MGAVDSLGCRHSSTPFPSDHNESWQWQLGTREGLISLWHCSHAPAGCPLMHPPSIQLQSHARAELTARPWGSPGTWCLLTPSSAPHISHPHRNLAVPAPVSSMSESPRFLCVCHQVRVESPQHLYLNLQSRNPRSEWQPPHPGQSRL